MNESIELSHLSDRELLVLAVQTVNELKKAMADHDRRLRSLENLRWTIGGGIATVAFIITVFGIYVVGKI